VDLVSTPYSFDARFECAVTALLVVSTRFFNRIGPHLDPERFSNPSAKLLVTAACDIYEKTGKAPGSEAVVLQRIRAEHERGRVKSAHLEACADYLMDGIDAGLPDVDVTIELVSDVVKRVQQEAVMDRAFVTFAERGDMTEVARKLEAVESIGRNDASYGATLDDFAQELDRLGTVDRLPTGFKELDAETGGGPARGEFVFWLAGQKIGKSMALVQNAAIGMYRGLHVAVATLELDEIKWRARVLGTITGTPYQDILQHGKKSVAFERYESIMQDGGMGLLAVHKFGGHQTPLSAVLDWVRREEDRRGKRVELLVIDYADKLIGRNISDSEYVQMRDVYEGIRLWALDSNSWAWSASQAQRIAIGEMPTANHCADSQHKVRVTDGMIGITRTPDENNNVSAKILAWRNGPGEGKQAGPLPNGFEFGCYVRSAAYGIEVEDALLKGDGDLGIFS